MVVLGAAADEARALLPDDARVDAVVAEGWADGIGESLRTGLAHATGDAALVTLVDLPGTPVSVVERVLRGVGTPAPGGLRRSPGPPGPHRAASTGSRWRRAWRATAARAPYLRAHGVTEVECGDLHHGRDDDGAT